MLIALALLLLTAAPAPTRVPFAWPTPDLIEQVDVPGTLRSGSIPIRLRAVRLRRSVEQLYPLYRDAYRRSGFFSPPPRAQVNLFNNPAITAIDPYRMISYTAIFQANRDGTTTVVLGEANLSIPATPATAGVPVPPSARAVLRTSFEGGEVIAYEAGPADEVRRFYGDVLGRAGYAKVDGAPLAFEGPNDSVDITVAELSQTQSRVTVVHRRGAPPAR